MKKAAFASLASRGLETGLTLTGHPALAKIGGIVLAAFMDRVVERFGEANRKKLEDWLHEIAASNQYASAEETIRIIEEHIDEPWARGPLDDAVRAIRDGIDEAALVYLANLAASQFRDKRPPDRWSRRAARLLSDCDAQMIAALVHLARNLSELWPPDVGDLVRIARGGPTGGASDVVKIASLHGRPRDPVIGENAWSAHPLSRELFALLRSHQFATEEGGRHAHEGKMLMYRSEAVYLVRIFLGSVAAEKVPGGKS